MSMNKTTFYGEAALRSNERGPNPLNLGPDSRSEDRTRIRRAAMIGLQFNALGDCR